MAINKSEFTIKIETNLKSNKQYSRFYINFKKDSIRTEKVLDFTNKEWDKRTRVTKAKQTLMQMKDKQSNFGININDNSTLNQIAEVYFVNREVSKWTEELKSVYKVHIEKPLGKRKVKDIRRVHLDILVTSMKKKGHSKQTANGCSNRTIKKAIIETLKPIFQYAVDNNILPQLPSLPTIKLMRKKKLVTNGGQKLITLFNTINSLYLNDPYYHSLFLFLLFGRRWNEVRTLNWSDINLLENKYTIRAENNKIGENQTYDLAVYIVKALLQIEDDRMGLVFKSPITKKELHPPKVQLSKIRDKSNIEELTLHYFRHIFVSAMGEMGTATTVLSASLGHTNLQTVNEFYLSANHEKSSKQANDTIIELFQGNTSDHI